MSDLSRCQFSEGSIALPEAYQDRTINVFASASGQSPALNISRDQLKPQQTLADYVDSQLELLSQNIKGWKQDDRQTITLGCTALPTEQVAASFLREGQRMWQLQAVSALPNGQVLVFTLSKTEKISEQDHALWQRWLASFAPQD
jgi:hypothetical protein